VRHGSGFTFVYGYPVFPTTFVEEAVFSSMHIFVTFVKNQMPVTVWAYF
jgi:hypothetical protein